jgi:predicted transcriptional regulator
VPKVKADAGKGIVYVSIRGSMVDEKRITANIFLKKLSHFGICE